MREFSDDEFELMEESPEEEAPVPKKEPRQSAQYFRDLRDTPPAPWEDCVGKSVPPQGFTWPEGFCLGCKATRVDPETGEKCQMCGGTGRIPVIKFKNGRRVASDQPDETPKVSSKWLVEAPEYGTFPVVRTSDGRVSRGNPREPGEVTWQSPAVALDAVLCSVRVFRLAESKTTPGLAVEGVTVTMFVALAEQREVAITAAEKCARMVEQGKDVAFFPYKIDLFNRRKKRKA